MIRSKSMMDQLVWRIFIANYTSHNKVIEYHAWLPQYAELFGVNLAGVPITSSRVLITYTATAFNATVDIFVDPYRKVKVGDTPYRVFQGVSYRRTEDMYSAKMGLFYACRDALRIGWAGEYRDPEYVPYERNVWSSIRALCQALQEVNDFEYVSYLRVNPEWHS